MDHRPALRRSSAGELRRKPDTAELTELSLRRHDTCATDHMATLRAPFDQPAWEYLEPTNTSEEYTIRARKPRYFSSLPSPLEDHEQLEFTSPISDDEPAFPEESLHQHHTEQDIKKGRYYSYALSEEDKQALSVGEKNHNLKEWAPKDLLKYQASRVDLVPHCANRGDMIASVLEDWLQSEKLLENQVSGFWGTQSMKMTPVPPARMVTYRKQTHRAASQSMVDLRASSTPISTPSPLSPTPLSPQSLQVSRSYLNTHSRNVSVGDYFGPRPALSPSARHSNASTLTNTTAASRTRNRRMPRRQPHQRKEDVTFDTFLVPHTSGKGEAYRGADNAKKEDEQNDSSPTFESSGRRLSKMPSIPALRKRLSQVGTLSPRE